MKCCQSSTVTAQSDAGALSTRTLNSQFKFRLGRRCLYLVNVLLYCLDKGHDTSLSLIQGVLLYVKKWSGNHNEGQGPHRAVETVLNE
jgi:hypothetical protein